MPNDTAAIYVRISQDKTGRKAGVRRQRSDCEAKAAELGLNVVEVVTDNDTTASDRRKTRPGYKHLLDLIESGEVDTVVVWNVDRLYRRPAELEHLIELAEDGALPGGVQVVTAGELDLNSVSGRQTARILVSIAKGESERISERVKAAGKQAADEGRPHGGRRPIGFESDGITIYEPEAKMLREAASRILSGDTLHAICVDWNTEGLRTPKGAQWRTPTLRGALLRPRIVGKRTHRGEVVGDAVWPPIISEATWRRVTAILTDPKRVTNRNGERSWLSGLIECGVCGSRMTQVRRSTDRKRLFSCRPASSGARADGCGSNMVVAERVETSVAETITGLLADPGTLAAVAELSDDAAEELAGLFDRLEAINVKAQELGPQLYLADGVDRVALQAALDELKRQEDQVQRRINAVSGRPESIDLAEFEEAISRWDDLTVGGRREIAGALIEAVVVAKALRKGQPWDGSRVTVRMAG